MSASRLEPMTVMVTGCGARGAIGAIVDGLRRSQSFDVRIVGTDADEFAAGRRLVDRFVRLPRAEAPGHRAALAAAVAEYEPSVVLPLADPELAVIHDLAGDFGYQVAALNRDSAALWLDKSAGLRLLGQSGLSGTSSLVATKPGEIRDAVSMSFPRLRLPLIAKPRAGSGGRETWLLEDEPTDLADWERDFIRVTTVEEFEELHEGRLDRFVVMPFAAGVHYTVTCVTIQGAVVSLPVRRRRFSPGVTWAGRLVEHPGIIAATTRLDEVVSLDPIANVQLVEGHDGTLSVYEVNPRLSTTSSVFRGIGLNVPDALLHELTGRDYKLGPVPWGASFSRYAQEVVWAGGAGDD